MSVVEDSISQLRAVRDSIDGGRTQVSSASEELERHQGAIDQASRAIEEVSNSTATAADGLEQLASATRALNYDSTAASVENAKERVSNATAHLLAARQHVEQAASEIGLVRRTLGETSGTLDQSDTAVEEAISRLSSLPLSGGASGGSGAREFLSELRFKLPRNHMRLGNPHSRHRLRKVAKSKYVDKENTVALPYIDLVKDAEAIRSGKALWNKKTERYHVNGRQYAAKDKDGKTRLYPVAGDGLIPLTSGEYKALQGMMLAGGDRAKRPEHFLRNLSIGDGDWDRAAVLYELTRGDEEGDRP